VCVCASFWFGGGGSIGFPETAIRRLEREATLLRRVSNTYLVQLLSHGFSEAKDVFWLVMEHLEGSSLDVIMHDPDMRYIIYIYRCIYRLML
jgi:serine/threonine protein kinase